MKNKRQHPRASQRGSTLVLAAAALLMLLGMAGFAIDALTLYVSRTDAQRAADAAALAGAKIFVSSSCTTAANCTTGSTQTLVKQAAEGAGAQNKVFGQYASIADSDITFPPSPTGDLHDPMVQVKVHRVIPTLFIGALSRMLGGNVSGITVAATATAEAFNPTGSNLPFGTGCIKPWLMPNCDGNQKNPANPACPGQAYLIQNGQIANPTWWNNGAGGAIGEPWTLHGNVLPSQYNDISFTGSNSSGNVYRNEIETCAPEAALACGSPVYLITGNKVGPTKQGVNNLIGGPNGQDTVNWNSPPPFPITAGGNNPYYPPGTTNITQSTSLVTVPIYDGNGVCSGNSCAQQSVIGFMQLFIDQTSSGAKDIVDAHIVNIAACSASGNGNGNGGPPVTGGGATLIPVRLVRNP
ncbi:MAG TPA: pilus assembly protein TadG-related protein [Terriglobales bacterium]|jgi:hypothetical protein|nr:pilus assembly protein TadG-related protein [Terriglobales bacterium]